MTNCLFYWTSEAGEGCVSLGQEKSPCPMPTDAFFFKLVLEGRKLHSGKSPPSSMTSINKSEFPASLTEQSSLENGGTSGPMETHCVPPMETRVCVGKLRAWGIYGYLLDIINLFDASDVIYIIL